MVKWCGTIRQTPALEKILTAAPPRFFQLATGMQTFNADVAGRVHRQSDAGKIEQNIRKLAAMNSVHLHADLIAGQLEKFLTGRRKLDSGAVRRAIDRDLKNSGAALKGMERQTRTT